MTDQTADIATGLSSIQILSLFIGVFIPILVDVVTKRLAHPAVKAAMLVLLAGLSGFLTEWMGAEQADVAFNWTAALLTWLVTFVTGVATFYGFWKPAGISGSAGKVQDATGNAGVGSNKEPIPADTRRPVA